MNLLRVRSSKVLACVSDMESEEETVANQSYCRPPNIYVNKVFHLHHNLLIKRPKAAAYPLRTNITNIFQVGRLLECASKMC